MYDPDSSVALLMTIDATSWDTLPILWGADNLIFDNDYDIMIIVFFDNDDYNLLSRRVAWKQAFRRPL